MLKAFAEGSVFGELYNPTDTWSEDGDANPNSLRRRDGTQQREGQAKVVLLHGWQRTHQDYKVLAGELSCPSLAIDLPGFGASPQPPPGWGTYEYASLVARVLEESDLKPIVVGHSFGGRVAVRLAGTRPDLVSGLVLTGVPLLKPSAGRKRSRPRLGYLVVKKLASLGVVPDGTLERARQRYGSRDYNNAHGVIRELLVRCVNETYNDSLEKIVCPTTLVWSDDDSEAPFEIATTLSQSYPEWKLVRLSGGGHLTPHSSPGRLAGEIEELIVATGI